MRAARRPGRGIPSSRGANELLGCDMGACGRRNPARSRRAPRLLATKLSRLDQLSSHRISNQTRNRIHIQLAHRGRAMSFRCFDADLEDGAYGLVAVTLRHQLDHELFSRGECLKAFLCRAAVRGAENPAIEERLVRQQRGDGGRQQLVRIRLDQKRPGPRVERLPREQTGVERRKDENFSQY